jgi:hypothetical protein
MKAVQLIAAIALLASAATAGAQMVERAPVVRTPRGILPPPPPPPVRVTPVLPQVAQPQCFDIVERDGPVYRTRTLCTR